MFLSLEFNEGAVRLAQVFDKQGITGSGLRRLDG